MRAALARLPEARARSGLAQRAMERAARLELAAQRQRRELLAHRWRVRSIHALAAMLLGALIWIGGVRLMGETQLASGWSNSSVSTTDAANTETTSASESILLLGGLLFILALAGVSAQDLLLTDRGVLAV
jgi:hypothetical protein